MSDNQLMIYSDSDRCIECWACEVACKQWHDIKAGTHQRRRVIEETSGTFPDVKRTFYSMSCMHCEEPACVAVCPAGAVTKRPEDGIVVVDPEKCIGCHYCYFACPYGVPDYTEDGMDKCDMCLSLKPEEDERPTPHCVETCPTQALYFGTKAEIDEILDEKNAARLTVSSQMKSL